MVVESAADASPTMAIRSPDMACGSGSVSGILITLFGVVLSASSLAEVNFGFLPDAVWAAATSAAAFAILLETKVSSDDCLLLSISSMSIGCSISSTPGIVESVFLRG